MSYTNKDDTWYTERLQAIEAQFRVGRVVCSCRLCDTHDDPCLLRDRFIPRSTAHHHSTHYHSVFPGETPATYCTKTWFAVHLEKHQRGLVDDRGNPRARHDRLDGGAAAAGGAATGSSSDDGFGGDSQQSQEHRDAPLTWRVLWRTIFSELRGLY